MTNRQLLIDFAKFIAKDEMYSHNENCFTIPGGKTFTSEQLADSFLSTLPSEQGKQEEGEKLKCPRHGITVYEDGEGKTRCFHCEEIISITPTK